MLYLCTWHSIYWPSHHVYKYGSWAHRRLSIYSLQHCAPISITIIYLSQEMANVIGLLVQLLIAWAMNLFYFVSREWTTDFEVNWSVYKVAITIKFYHTFVLPFLSHKERAKGHYYYTYQYNFFLYWMHFYELFKMV